METQSNENQNTAEVASYVVLAYPGSELPETYRNLIYSKWLRSLRYGNDYYKLIDSDAYFAVYQKYIELLLNRSNAIVRLAVLSDDHDVVLGFSLIEGTALHYVHVHHDQRKQGIGTSLVPTKIEFITHITNIGMSIWNNKLSGVKFNPFI